MLPYGTAGRGKLASFALLGLLLMGVAAQAAVLRVPADYGTIAEAVAAAQDGDEVLIADGTYTSPGNRDVDLAGKAITIRSENGPLATVLDMESQGRAFLVRSAEGRDTVIEGLTIMGGYLEGTNDEGGAIVIQGASPTIRDCRFLANGVEGFNCGGGAIGIVGGSPLIERCSFEDNRNLTQNGEGGALFARSGGVVEVLDCEFVRNSSEEGGAVGLYLAELRMARCRFRLNQSTSG